jgi:signal transduction histidine kinase/CHASE3 domain sensor protein
MAAYIMARANAAVFAAIAVVLLIVGGLTWERFEAARESRQWSEHSHLVLATTKDLALALRDAETGQRGFLLTGSEEYLTPYEAALGRVGQLQAELRRLTADNSGQQARLDALAVAVRRKLQELAHTVQLRRDGGMQAALPVVRSNLGLEYMRDIEATLAAMSQNEETLLRERSVAASRRNAWVRVLVFGGTAIAVAAMLWAWRAYSVAWRRSQVAETEQRSLALRLRTSLDSLSQGVAVFSPALVLTDWNDCFRSLLQLPKALFGSGVTYTALVRQMDEFSAGFLENEEQIRRGRQLPGEPVVYERTVADGAQLELRRTSMRDGGFVLTVTDMTKRAQAEAVLRDSQKMQAIGQLTGGIAHDFNNLLTVIFGNLEYLRARLGRDEALQTRIERAEWAAQRGATLTAQLLAFARKQALAPVPINLAATMPDLVPLLRRTLGEHIELRYVEGTGLWPAMADPAQLEAAVLNLALNARDAMPGGGRLTIELANKVIDEDYASRHAEVLAGDYTMLAVSDTGHGMTPEVMARAFEPFFTTKPEGKGTGLGLAMVFGFVKQSGGHVKIYSEPGEGTTVRIYLPRALFATGSVGQRSGAPIELPRGSATVLVVEDELSVREIAVGMLRDLGYRVLEAADGEEGLRVFGSHAAEVDVLLTDVVLPGKVRGRDMAERISAMRPDMRVLFMSGYTENAIVHHGRLDAGVRLIGKPFKREQLARKVADVLAAPPEPVPPRRVDPANVVELKSRRSP